MADVTKNPFFFVPGDVGATDQIANIGTRGRLRVHLIRWVAAGAAGDAAIIKDNAGRTLWSSIASSANFVDNCRVMFWFRDGLVINALTSGILYIYLEEGIG